MYGEKIAIIGENLDEINDIIERLVKELKPVGINQEIIVSKMVDLAIRLRRIPLLEAGVLNQEMQEYNSIIAIFARAALKCRTARSNALRCRSRAINGTSSLNLAPTFSRRFFFNISKPAPVFADK